MRCVFVGRHSTHFFCCSILFIQRRQQKGHFFPRSLVYVQATLLLFIYRFMCVIMEEKDAHYVIYKYVHDSQASAATRLIIHFSCLVCYESPSSLFSSFVSMPSFFFVFYLDIRVFCTRLSVSVLRRLVECALQFFRRLSLS